MVTGTGIQQRFWTSNGTMIRSRNSIKYLGYSRNSKEEDHLTHRVEQTRKASLTMRSILQQLPDLPIEKQIQIANAWTRSVFLYGTEACMEKEQEHLKSEMNKILRRLGRKILQTSHAPANQTLQLDLGWQTMKSELQMRKVKIALKALHSSQQGRIFPHVLREAMYTGTPWTDEVNEHIGDACGRGKWLGNLTTKDEIDFPKLWLMKDSRSQHARLERTVWKTTGLFKELTEANSSIKVAPYITTNPRINEEIRTIFALRSGSSTLRADMENRHRAETAICRLCGMFDETARHVLDDCQHLESRRRKIRRRLDKFQQTYGELLSDITLSNEITEARLRRAGLKNYQKIDTIRKDAIKQMMKKFT